MINSTSNNEYTFHTSSDASSRVEKTNDLHNQEQGRKLKFWPTCDPNIKECNGGLEIYGVDEEGVLKKWYCYPDDDRKRINGDDRIDGCLTIGKRKRGKIQGYDPKGNRLWKEDPQKDVERSIYKEVEFEVSSTRFHVEA
ncbi:hypothetical protein Tco_0982883, partial [Tanacetum coccineum]